MTRFDAAERLRWRGQAQAYGASFGALCASPVDALLDAAHVTSGTCVLDVGTGTGAAALAALGRGAVVTAVDAEPSMVEIAAGRLPAADVGLATLPELAFDDDSFDAVVANFVINHVGQPRRALAELRRVTRPGGWVAVTVWAVPAAPGQALLGRAVGSVGVRSDQVSLEPAEDFIRTTRGMGDLLTETGLRGVTSRQVSWDHRVTPEVWWSGPASGMAAIGQLIVRQPPDVVRAIRASFDVLSAEFVGPDGVLVLPHTAVLVSGQA